MHARTILAVAILLAPCRALADIAALPEPAAGSACRQAIMAAERSHNIPSHLLAAIARVESGRRDPVSGAFDPWPWTINLDGQGSFYDNKAQAVAAAAAMRPRAAKSLDVGCMQISLTFHPDAFRSIETAFDPAMNAEYGAQFLMQLYQKTGSWPRAVEMYHSATPDIGQEYGRRVYAALPEEQKMAAAAQPYPEASLWSSPLGRSLLLPPLRQGAAHMIPQTAGMMGGAPAGHSLDFYRAASVRMAFRAP